MNHIESNSLYLAHSFARTNGSINRAHRQANFRNPERFGRSIKREQPALRRVYTRPKTKRSLTIRHAATMIPRVTIPASGNGQIRRKARRARGRGRQRARRTGLSHGRSTEFRKHRGPYPLSVAARRSRSANR